MLAPVRPDDPVAAIIAETLVRSPFRAEDIEDVVLGCLKRL